MRTSAAGTTEAPARPAVARLRALRRDDDGNILVMVICVGFAFAVLALGLAATTIFATVRSSVTRADVQVQAAADAGVDDAIKQVNSVMVGQESHFQCSTDKTVTTSQGTSHVTTDIRYKTDHSSNAFVCDQSAPFADETQVLEVEIVAHATLTTSTGAGEDTAQKTVKQVLKVAPNPPGEPLFKYGVFSNSPLSLTNSFTVRGGGMFTNGSYSCNSAGTVEGGVTALGDVYLTNSCKVDGVWTAGNFKCDSNPQVLGDVTVSGTATFSNGCKVTGNFWAGNNVSMTNGTASIVGNLISSAGKIDMSTSASTTVGGFAQAGLGIVTSGNRVGGAVIPNTPTQAPPSPADEVMPAITYNDLVGAGSGSPSVKLIKPFLNEASMANPSFPSWANSTTYANVCDVASWNYNQNLVSPAVPTILDARDCPTLTMQGATLKLRADLTLVVNNFTMTNSFQVTGEDPTKTYKLRIIAPIAPGAPTCSGTASYTFTNSGTTSYAPNVQTMFYTNGNLSWSNTMTLTGSVYACNASNAINNVTITYADMTPPGMDNPAAQNYNFQPFSRYDLS